MLWVAAWRNLWRNKRRTLILVAAITVGLWGVLASMAFVNAWLDDSVKNAVSTTVGHVQIQAPGYHDNPQVRLNLPDDAALLGRLRALAGVRGACARVQAQVLLSNSEKAEMGLAVGADPATEPTVSVIPKSIVEGQWLKPGERGGIVVGREFLKRFKTRLGRRVVLRGTNAAGDVSDASFRIVGVFQTAMLSFDRSTVYITLADAQTVFGLEGKVTEYVLVTDSPQYSERLKPLVVAAVPRQGFAVTTWQEQLPMVVQLLNFSGGIMWYFYSFFFIAMAFGIANSFLMVVHERTREIGMMLALGVRRRTIMGVLLIESFLLAVVASLVGNGISYAMVDYLHHHGLDLSAWAEGMSWAGMSQVMYPFLTPQDIASATIATAITALVMTTYPAWKASRLRPVQALRTM